MERLKNLSFTIFDFPFLFLLIGTLIFGRAFTILKIQLGSIPVFITELILFMYLLFFVANSRVAKKTLENIMKAIPVDLRVSLIIYVSVSLIYLMLAIPLRGMIAFRDIVLSIYPILIFLTIYVVNDVEKCQDFLKLMYLSAIACILVGLVSLGKFYNLHLFSGTIFNFFEQMKRFNITLFLGFIVIFALVFYEELNKRNRVLPKLIISFSICLIAVLAVRTAWVASIVTLFVLVWLMKTVILKNLIKNIPLTIILIVFGVLTSGPSNNTAEMLARKSKAMVQCDAQGSEAGNIRWRFQAWEQALLLGLEKPFLGNGYGLQPDYLINERSFSFPEGVLPGMEAHSPHNHILTIFYKMGFLGLSLFLLINFRVFMLGYLYLKRCKNDFLNKFLIASLGSLVYWHSMALLFDMLEAPTTNIFLWIILGLIISIVDIDKNHLEDITNS